MNRIRTWLAFALLSLLAACGGHPLAGSWHEHLPDGKAGMTFEFDSGSDRLQIHTAPRADGGHDHLDGTYELDGTKLSVTWQEGGAAVSLTGELAGDKVTLQGGGRTLELAHSDEAGHGH